MKSSREAWLTVKEFFVGSILIASAGIIFTNHAATLGKQAASLANENLKGVRVGELSQFRTSWGKLDPERDWVESFFEEL